MDGEMAKKVVEFEVEDEVEDEVEEGLVGRSRRSRVGNGNGSLGAGEAAQAEQQQEEEEVKKGADECNGSNGKHQPGEVFEDVKEEGNGENHQKSIYYDQDQGVWKCRHCLWTHRVSNACINHFQSPEGYCQGVIDVKILSQHGLFSDSHIKGIKSTSEPVKSPSELIEPTSEFTTTEESAKGESDLTSCDMTNIIPITENCNYPENANLEVQSSQLLYSEDCHANGTTGVISGVGEYEQTTPPGQIRHELAGIDVERVLEEQDTHDLYCPNCNSCITKRVILRKRKRIVRGKLHIEAKKREKIQPVQTDEIAISDAAEITEERHETEPDVFRCLSCFSFFIPTERGFRLFNIFGKREESENLHTPPQHVSAKNSNWISSLFESMKGKRKEDEPGIFKVQHTKDNEKASSSGTEEIRTPPPTIPISDGQRVNEQEHALAKDGKISLDSQESGSSLIINLQVDKKGKLGFVPENNKEVIPESDEIVEEKDHHFQVSINDHVSLGLGGQTAGKFQSTMEDAKTIHVEDAKTGHLEEVSGYCINETANKKYHITDLTKDITKSTEQDRYRSEACHSDQPLPVSLPPSFSAHVETQIYIGEHGQTEIDRTNDRDVLKAIVYGGLIEAITSLGVVSSAAGADATTLNIVALGLANLFGGIFLLAHNLMDLRNDQYEAADQNDKQSGRYWESLGRRGHFGLHATVVMISFIIAGLLPPVIYGFAFRKSDNKEYKLIAVAAASLMCIALLVIAKAYVQRTPKPYIKNLSYYLGLGVTISGLSYVAGVLIKVLLEKLGVFNGSSTVTPSPPSNGFLKLNLAVPSWASY